MWCLMNLSEIKTELDLGGLEPLLDQIFATDGNVVRFEPYAVARNNAHGRISDYSCDEILQSQLKNSRSDLTNLQTSHHFLEMQLESQTNQLDHLPDILQIALKSNRLIAENRELKRENEHLRILVRDLIQEVERTPARTWLKRLFRLAE